MNKETNMVMFALLRSAVCGDLLSGEEKSLYDAEMLSKIVKIARQHDVLHLVAFGLKKNDMLDGNSKQLETEIFKAVYRYEQQSYELSRVCETLEKANIPFIPLKGSVLRKFYPKPWMRTSCDIDILVHNEDLEKAILCLSENLKYSLKGKTTHDVSLFAPNGICIELHYDLVEEGRANNAIEILGRVWDNVTLCKNSSYQYEMTDAFFYFYHIAHMAKHFETGGCGIRPFIDLVVLNGIGGVDFAKRDELLNHGGLLQFAKASRKLSRVWFGNEQGDAVSEEMQDFILRGGSYGTMDNRVAAHKKQGKIKYILSRMFVPYDKLRRYYPVLEKHKWLTPIMQIRRWFMMLDPKVRRMAESEIVVNNSISVDKVRKTQALLKNIGL